MNTSTGQVFDWVNPLGVAGGAVATSPPDICDVGSEFDSAAEDCTTGIALATLEFSDQLFLLDLTRASFDSAHSTWSAPSQYVTIPELRPFVCNDSGAGTAGISIAPSSHLGAVAGEFGGNDFLAIQLPATAGGSGTTPPALVDYVFAQLPATPDGKPWQSGKDPHTLTTYTSPTNGHSYAIFEDDAFQDGTRTYLAVVDLAAMLNPTISVRGASPHTVAAPSTCGGPGPNPTGAVPPSVPSARSATFRSAQSASVQAAVALCPCCRRKAEAGRRPSSPPVPTGPACQKPSASWARPRFRRRRRQRHLGRGDNPKRARPRARPVVRSRNRPDLVPGPPSADLRVMRMPTGAGRRHPHQDRPTPPHPPPPELMEILQHYVDTLPAGRMLESELLFPSLSGGYRAPSCLADPADRSGGQDSESPHAGLADSKRRRREAILVDDPLDSPRATPGRHPLPPIAQLLLAIGAWR